MVRAVRTQIPGRCIFCRGTGLTKEHVLPDWLRVIFPRSATDTHTFGSYDWPCIIGHAVPIQNTRSAQGQIGSKKVRVVCRACNNGWLSQLEAAVQPILSDLISGYARTLTVAD